MFHRGSYLLGTLKRITKAVSFRKMHFTFCEKLNLFKEKSQRSFFLSENCFGFDDFSTTFTVHFVLMDNFQYRSQFIFRMLTVLCFNQYRDRELH